MQRQFVIVVAAVVACGVLVGCDAKEPGGGPIQSDDAGLIEREPVSLFDAGVPTTGSFCTSQVAAECDGNEDCTGGQICCGTFAGGGYTSIKCQDTCGGDIQGFQLCHPGESCPAPPGTDAGAASAPICRRSTVLPSYLAICNTPSDSMLIGFTGRPAAAGPINCGPDNACASGEQCCVLANWDAMTRTSTVRAGYCAAIGTQCACADAPDLDGGL